MTKEQVRERFSFDVRSLFNIRAESLSYDDCVKLIADAIEVSKDASDILTAPIDRIAWLGRCSYLTGYYNALQDIQNTWLKQLSDNEEQNGAG